MALKTSYNGKKLNQSTTINRNLSGNSSTTITSPSGKTGTTSISWPGLGSSSSKKSTSSSDSSDNASYYSQWKANGGSSTYTPLTSKHSLTNKSGSLTSSGSTDSSRPTLTNTAGSLSDIASPDYTDLSSIATPTYMGLDSLSTPEYISGTTPDLSVDNSESQSWKSQLNNIYNQIVNRGAFKYDQSSDPLYQQYAEMYQNNANLAMQNTVGQVSSMTGGYGNSYAETAGQSMYNQYMDNLNSKALELYNAAEDTYNNETSRLMNNYSLASSQYSNAVNEEQTAYEKLLDQYNIENALRQEQNEYNMNMYGYQVDDLNNQNNYNSNMYGYALSNAQAMNALKQSDWQTNLSNYWNQRQMDYDTWRAQTEDYESDRNYEYTKSQDEVANSLAQQELAEKIREYDLDRSDSNDRWQKEYDRDYEEWLKEFEQGQYEYKTDNDYRYDALDQDQSQFDSSQAQDQSQYESSLAYQRESDNYENQINNLQNTIDARDGQTIKTSAFIKNGGVVGDIKSGEIRSLAEFNKNGGAHVKGTMYTDYPSYFIAYTDAANYGLSNAELKELYWYYTGGQTMEA